MNVNGILGRASLGVMAVALSVCFAHASTEAASTTLSSNGAPANDTARSAAQEETRLAKLLKEASFSPGVSDVVRMTRSGTDTSILIAHVQASDHAYKLRPEDVVHLNDNEVPDSVIASMIVRGAAVRSQIPPVPPAVQPVPPSQPCASPTAIFVSAPKRSVPRPASTVTVIGRSYGTRGVSYRNHFYSARNVYSGTYGRGYSVYDRYSHYDSSYRRGGGGRHRW